MRIRKCIAFFCSNLLCSSQFCGGSDCKGFSLVWHNFDSIDDVLRHVKFSFNGHFVGDCVISCYDQNDFLFAEYYVTFPGAIIRLERFYDGGDSDE